jgi:hypothetical protein
MKYLTIQEIQCVGPDSCEDRIDALMEALLDLEAVDNAITDPDLAAESKHWPRRCSDDR